VRTVDKADACPHICQSNELRAPLRTAAPGLAATGIVELLIAILTNSVGLLGDVIHNLSDVSTSAVVFLGFRLSRRAPTERYPYGLDRTGIGIAIVIWASAVFAGFESVRKLLAHSPTDDIGLGILGAVLGIIGNQIVARYKLVTGRRINSATLIADARHSRLDALSSAGASSGSSPSRSASDGEIRWPA
jgi:cation diffusion facilitator family transporter